MAGGGSTCWRAVWLPVVSREMWTEHLAGQPLNKFMCHARSIDTDIVLAIEQQEDGQDRHFQQFAQSLVALSRGSWRTMTMAEYEANGLPPGRRRQHVRGRVPAPKLVKLKTASGTDATLWALYLEIRSLQRAAGVANQHLHNV